MHNYILLVITLKNIFILSLKTKTYYFTEWINAQTSGTITPHEASLLKI